ncbi:TlpA family protein disulfide reductase [Tenacibaculum piscium]|uniref:TlpA family protein disulfide reductase n=1 Tax=Tenacibaculum piscium TaxID=1458515 RepID=UPI001EFB4605|nr:TlpA disulfide reductase family protein [Tenacibaculum piscium]MCG8184114.1 TlpA family protein disulfide reductase [Tenacibaculum piscium]MCG8205507.1 TlpA family protein disulfide reductase [Tenacibaculum piscium]
MNFIKKNSTNILFAILIGLLLYPPTKVHFIRLISFSPSVISVENSVQLKDYHWNLKGLNTSDLDFNQTKNKVIFVNFWATWCPPCIAEMPSIQKLYDDYKDEVTFIFVNNENWNTISDFYVEKNYNLPTYTGITDTPPELKSSSIPATFIIDKKGHIIADKKGASNWNSKKVRTLLDELIK